MTDHQPPLQWRKSTYSGQNGSCVELAPVSGGVIVRNSNRIEDGTLTFTRAELAAFLDGAKAGEFDDLV